MPPHTLLSTFLLGIGTCGDLWLFDTWRKVTCPTPPPFLLDADKVAEHGKKWQKEAWEREAALLSAHDKPES